MLYEAFGGFGQTCLKIFDKQGFRKYNMMYPHFPTIGEKE
jgi:hypothetical protein